MQTMMIPRWHPTAIGHPRLFASMPKSKVHRGKANCGRQEEAVVGIVLEGRKERFGKEGMDAFSMRFGLICSPDGLGGCHSS